MEAKIPIVVSEMGDLSFFLSVRDAEMALEAIDVEGGIYEVFDADGVPLDLRLVEQEVRIALPPGSAEPQPEKLKFLIRRYLSDTRRELPRAAELSELLKMCELDYYKPPRPFWQWVRQLFKAEEPEEEREK